MYSIEEQEGSQWGQSMTSLSREKLAEDMLLSFFAKTRFSRRYNRDLFIQPGIWSLDGAILKTSRVYQVQLIENEILRRLVSLNKPQPHHSRTEWTHI